VGKPEEKGNKEEAFEQRQTQTSIIREKVIVFVTAVIFAADQITKALVVFHFVPKSEIATEIARKNIVIIKGFLDIIHRTNDGAAFSIMAGKNNLLAVISFFAMGGLIWFREHFDNGTRNGKIALGLLMGGILGNLLDRVFRGSVVDFIRVYIERRGGGISEWPAFNIADAAICTGVGLLFYIAWKEESRKKEPS
tara:strand:- start:184 stop:768 length:585 start_codon:yes stop_codon:yes gene_type:complete